MIYAEWLIDGILHNGHFENWADFHTATFDPDIELKRLDVKIGNRWFSREF